MQLNVLRGAKGWILGALLGIVTPAAVAIDSDVAQLFPGIFFEDADPLQNSDAFCSGTTVCPPGVVDLNGKGAFRNETVIDADAGRATHSFSVPIQGSGDGTTLDIQNIELVHSLGGLAQLPPGPLPRVTRSGNGVSITSEISAFNVTYNTLNQTVLVSISLNNVSGDTGIVSITWRGKFAGAAISGNLPQSSILTPEQQQTALRNITTEMTNHFDVWRGFLQGNGRNRSVGRQGDTMSFHKTGLSAGDGDYRWGAWGSVTWTDSENDSVLQASTSQRLSFLAGVDYTPWSDNVIFGFAVGYENTDTDTRFNGGEQQVDGVTIAPYLAAFWGDHFSADITVGYTSLSADQFRVAAGNVVSSKVDSDRWFTAANANYITTRGPWTISGRAGLVYARDKADAFTESDGTSVGSAAFKLGMLSVGLEAAYAMGAWEPFGSLTYENDFSKTTVRIGGVQLDSDDAGVVAGAGVRYFGAGNTSAVLQFSSVLGREDLDEYTLSATIRADF